MTWLQRYRLRRFVRTSFWLFPVCGLVIALVAAPVVRWFDYWLDWRLMNFTPDGARAVLDSLSGSMLTFLVFAMSSMLLVLQLASAQLTPRIIALAFSMPLPRICVTVFSFTYAFSIAALGRVEERVPQLSVFIALVGNFVSISLFFWFVHQLARGLRPVAILQIVAEEGCKVIDNVYPHLFDPFGAVPVVTHDSLPKSMRTEPYTRPSGVLLAFGADELLKLAHKADCVIEIVPQVGDFVSRGDPLFRIYPSSAPISAKHLQEAIAIGTERTLEQDPGFALRVMVDIASRALSPAINDPTTAVLAIDQIHRLLRYIGSRQLAPGVEYDDEGKLRLLYPTPHWEDIVGLAVNEIRLFGAGSIQIPRRLRAMLEHLIKVLPEARTPSLRQELELVHAAIERHYAEPLDRHRAEAPDLQGIGGLRR